MWLMVGCIFHGLVLISREKRPKQLNMALTIDTSPFKWIYLVKKGGGVDFA